MSLPTGSSDWRQLIVIAVAAATRFGSGVLMGTAMAVLVGRRGSPFAVSIVTTAYYIGLMLFAPLWGAIADVTGRRRPLLVATSAMATIAVLPLVVAQGVWAQIGLRTLYAVFAAGFSPIMLTVVSQSGGAEARGQALGFFNSSRAIGTTSARFAAGALLGLLAPPAIFLVIAGVTIATTLTALQVSDPTPTANPDASVADILTEVRKRLFPAAGQRGHLTTKGLQWLYVGLALRNMTVLGVMSLMPIYLTEAVGVSEFAMGALLALNPAGQSMAMYLFGQAADAFGRKTLITGGMTGSGAFALMSASATLPESPVIRIAIAALAFIVIAVTYSAMQTGSAAFIGDVAAETRESELMGLLSTAKGTGGVIGPPLVGTLATFTSYQMAFVVGSVLAFTGATLTALRLVESRPEAPSILRLAR